MNLINYMTGEILREATYSECCESFRASLTDGGTGVILVAGVSCFVDTDPDTAAQREILGDCHACVQVGNASPGVGSERAVWVGPGGEVSEDTYHVCSECLAAAKGGPGYYRA